MNHVASRPELGHRRWSWNVLRSGGVDFHLHRSALVLAALGLVMAVHAGYGVPTAAAAALMFALRAAWLRSRGAAMVAARA